MKQKIKITREQIEQALDDVLQSRFHNYAYVLRSSIEGYEPVFTSFPPVIEIEVDVPEKDTCEKARDAHGELLGRWEKHQTQKAIEKLATGSGHKKLLAGAVEEVFHSLLEERFAQIAALEKRIAALEAKSKFVFLREEDQVKDGPRPGPFGGWRATTSACSKCGGAWDFEADKCMNGCGG